MSGNKTLPSIGFLTVLEHPGQGWLGGYLLLNAAGRPLEFHCTAPVKPNRAQEILYGPTLKPFLFGEQIGQTLVAKSPLKPIFVCTDTAEVLSLQELVDFPVVLVLPGDGAPAGTTTTDLPREMAGWPRQRLGVRDVTLTANREADFASVSRQWSPYADGVDLLEPFLRIRDAVEETQRNER